MELKEESQFVCSLSSKMRSCLQLPMFEGIKVKIVDLTKSIVDTITSTDGVADSLKKESLPGVAKAMRQIDLRNDDGAVVFKSFTCWNYELKCWHVFLEGPEETFWEEQHSPIGNG